MGMKRGRLVLPPAQYKNLCIEVLRRDGWKCRVCKSRKQLSCHHIIYRSHQGDDATWNLVVLCERCHKAVHDRYILILSEIEDAVADANSKLKFMFVDGWKPAVKKTK